MERQRILIPHRIIPQELYVKRDADRQLQSILQDMASPGYVLVSRQMGKTNLLLNAKRSYQTQNDVYTYIDLSNSFDTDTECFRNIVDKSVDTHRNLLDSLKKEIKEIRKEQMPPHLEHLQELRLILNHITGKMVIILDEIDALTRASFSDRIFSQIRSIYFERDSYPELNRLTYILSGVVEPTEIIKNPKISPFNIGQKIFLDDFSFEEHQHFLEKAKLPFTSAISERVFYWTSGNPRMTYDICSEAETRLYETSFSTETIDAIVKRLYLTTFDKPPVDHIRELVVNDKAIRDALLLIRYGNGQKIEDNIKTRLYLAGIISSDFSSSELGIKNRIIDQSLSEAWIRTVEKQSEKVDDLINEIAKSGNYKRTLDFYESLKEDEIKELKNNTKYNVGLSYFKQGDFNKAINLFNNVNYDAEYERSRYLENQLLLAESYENDNHIEKAVELFEYIVQLDKKGKYHTLAILHLANIYIDFENGKYRSKAIFYLEEILRNPEIAGVMGNESDYSDYLTSAHLYYGTLLNKQGEYQKAEKELNHALDLAKDEAKPAIILAKINFTRDDTRSRQILNELVDIIIDTKLTPDPVTGSYIYFSSTVLYEVLEKVNNHLKSRFNDFCRYLIEEFSKLPSEQYLYDFYQLGFIAVSRQNFALANAIFEYLILNPRSGEILEEVHYAAFKMILTSKIPSRNEDLIMQKFYNFLTAHPKFVLSALELDVLISYADQEIAKRDFSKSQEILSFLTKSLEKIPEELRSSKYLIEFMEIKTLNLVAFNDAARERSKSLLQNINTLSSEEIAGNPLLVSSIPLMKNSLLGLSHVGPVLPRVGVPFQDNDRVTVQYTSGRIVKDIKYRKVRKDISSGQCRILS